MLSIYSGSKLTRTYLAAHNCDHHSTGDLDNQEDRNKKDEHLFGLLIHGM
jgi:hypothetical protein